MDGLVPIVAVVCAVGLPLSIPIIYIILSYLRRRRTLELHHAERMAAIERGMEIPPLPPDIWGPRNSRSTLLPGLIWLLVGLALTAGLYGSNGFGMSGFTVWGLVPTAVGIAYLIHYFVEGRKRARPPEEKS
ncbi:MAG: DUF6249 domain-containing protein [Steroidobacteraceae bacterium]